MIIEILFVSVVFGSCVVLFMFSTSWLRRVRLFVIRRQIKDVKLSLDTNKQKKLNYELRLKHLVDELSFLDQQEIEWQVKYKPVVEG